MQTQSLSLAGTFDADTPLGTIQIKGSNMQLTVNMLFSMVRDLQAKVDVLTKQFKNTGMIFERYAFALEAEFALWFIGKNPSGDGLAAFVNVISIWTFGAVDHMESSQWLNNRHRSKSIGLKDGALNVGYAHLMSTRYPAQFVGKD
jgi:hypothetical protein